MLGRLTICRKSDSGFGGGGGRSSKPSVLDWRNLPAIQGTEKQRSWADDIRAEASTDFNRLSLAAEKVMQGKGEDKPGRDDPILRYGGSSAYKTYRQNMMDATRDVRRFADGKPSGRTENEMIRSFVNDVRKNITTQTDARYWIDRRNKGERFSR